VVSSLFGCFPALSGALICLGDIPLVIIVVMSRRIPKHSSEESAQYGQGVRNFSVLFTRWMDTNEWSHPVMTVLAKGALNGTAWLHSSQISGLRHGELYSPGPRTFVAIERLNYYVFRYITEKKLIPGTTSSSNYSKAFAIVEDNSPPPLGWWVEVFCGVRTPKDIDLKMNFFSDTQARELSLSWASLIRGLMIAAKIDIITDLETTIREYYPANDHARVAKILEVIRNKSTWEPMELTVELPAIAAFTAALGGPESEKLLLSTLQNR